METFIALGIQIIVAIISFCVGKYILPKLPAESASIIKEKLTLLSTYADKYVSWAEQFMKASTGEQRMEAVVKALSSVAERNNFEATKEDLVAITQNSFDGMKRAIKTAESSNSQKIEVLTRQVDSANSQLQESAISAANEALNTANDAVSMIQEAMSKLNNMIEQSKTLQQKSIETKPENIIANIEERTNNLKSTVSNIQNEITNKSEGWNAVFKANGVDIPEDLKSVVEIAKQQAIDKNIDN